MTQFLFLLIVGLLSAITCALILLCLNSNKQNPLVQNPQSPLSQKGMPQKQKRIILTIVFVIFFVSMILTSYKAGKYDYWFSGCVTDQLVQSVKSFSITNDKKDKFIGLNNGDCTLSRQQISDSQQQSQLTKMIENIKSDVIKRSFLNSYSKQHQPQTYESSNSNNTTNQNNLIREQQLSILISNLNTELTQKYLHYLSPNLCNLHYTGSNPTLYIDLEEEYLTSSALLKYEFGYPSYRHLKQAICRINDIQLRKQTLFSGQIVESYVKKSSKSASNKAYLIVNNFQNMLNTILDEVIAVQQQNIQYYSHTNQRKIEKNRNSQKSYSFFLDKLFNQLIQQCELNVVLFSTDLKSIEKLQKRWKLFFLNLQYNNSRINHEQNQYKNNQFPFTVKRIQSISEDQFLNILKVRWLQHNLNQEQLTKLFNDYFLSLRSNPTVFKQSSNTITTSENLSLKQNQIDKYLIRLEQYLKRKQQPKQTETFYREKPHSRNRHSNHQSQMDSVAKFHNVLESYKKLKSLNSHSILISYAKKMISLKQLHKMEEIGIITVNQGRVKLN